MEPHIPEVISVENLEPAPLIGPASIALVRYDGLLRGFVKPSHLLTSPTERSVPWSRHSEEIGAYL